MTTTLLPVREKKVFSSIPDHLITHSYERLRRDLTTSQLGYLPHRSRLASEWNRLEPNRVCETSHCRKTRVSEKADSQSRLRDKHWRNRRRGRRVNLRRACRGGRVGVEAIDQCARARICSQGGGILESGQRS